MTQPRIALSGAEQSLREQLLEKYDPTANDLVVRFLETAESETAEVFLTTWRTELALGIDAVFGVAAVLGSTVKLAPIAATAAWDFVGYSPWESEKPGDLEYAAMRIAVWGLEDSLVESAARDQTDAATLEAWTALGLPDLEETKRMAERLRLVG